MRILKDVLDRLDVVGSVQIELEAQNRLLPPPWSDLGLEGRHSEVASWLSALLRRDFVPDHEEVVLARKQGRGARPVALMALKDRIVYRAAVAIVANAAVLPVRGSEEYLGFVRAPLTVENCAYVLKTDISSYYQYVDHERLVDEVVAQTGDDLAVSTATELLRTVTGRRFGLPQLSDVSDVLGELYIDPMRRRMTRAGFTTFRYVDDFRVACRSYEEALAAWEEADHAARELGLVLNELKTTTPGLETYERSLRAVREREAEVFAGLGVDSLSDFSPYGPDEEDDEEELESLGDQGLQDDGAPASAAKPLREVSENQVAAAHAVIRLWLEDEDDDDARRAESATVTTELLRRALTVLEVGRDPRALEHSSTILVYEPSLTPAVSRYMLACVEVDERGVLAELDEVCSGRIFSSWQGLWLAHVAGHLPRRRRTGTTPDHVLWLRQEAFRGSGVLAAEALVALARRRLVTAGRAKGVVQGLNSVARPTGVMAVGVLNDEAAARDVSESKLDAWRAAWAADNL